MITVRFPSGVAVQYNTASYVLRSSDAWHLYEQKDGKWVASIQMSAGVMIEAVPACAVTAPGAASLHAGLDMLLSLLQAGQGGQVPSYKLKDLKRALARFNARSGYWK